MATWKKAAREGATLVAEVSEEEEEVGDDDGALLPAAHIYLIRGRRQENRAAHASCSLNGRTARDASPSLPHAFRYALHRSIVLCTDCRYVYNSKSRQNLISARDEEQNCTKGGGRSI